MAKKSISEAQIRARLRYEKELNEIEPLSPLARKLLSAQGFLDYFLEIRMLFPTYEDAYEMLEEQHERIIGKRMYSEYHFFRRGLLRWDNYVTHK